MQLQMLFEERSEHAVSPFDKAMAALDAGRRGQGRGGSPPTGCVGPAPGCPVPQAIDGAGLHRLLAVLPRPLPYGDPWNEYVLTNLLVSAAEYREAATYGAESFARQPQLLLAATIARAAGALGDEDDRGRLAARRRRQRRRRRAAWPRSSTRPPSWPPSARGSDVVALRASLQPTG